MSSNKFFYVQLIDNIYIKNRTDEIRIIKIIKHPQVAYKSQHAEKVQLQGIIELRREYIHMQLIFINCWVVTDEYIFHMHHSPFPTSIFLTRYGFGPSLTCSKTGEINIRGQKWYSS